MYQILSTVLQLFAFFNRPVDVLAPVNETTHLQRPKIFTYFRGNSFGLERLDASRIRVLDKLGNFFMKQ